LLTLSSLLTGLVLLVAILALLRARSLARRLDRMTDSYWELRYESGQLKARIARLEVSAGLRDPEPEAAAAQAPAKPTFIPLSSLKK
jgi:hypothetical protein